MLSAFLSLPGGGGAQGKRKTDTKVAKCTGAKRVCKGWLIVCFKWRDKSMLKASSVF